MERTVYFNDGNKAVLAEVTGVNLEILDIGCGAGDNARILSKGHHHIDGITYSEQESKICKNIMRQVYLHNLEYGLPVDIKNKYDYILCSHVLEHIAYPEQLLLDIKDRMKEGSNLIVALPNLMHYRSRLKLLFGVFEYEDSGIWDKTHLRWYTFKSGKELLERYGYVVNKSWVDGDVPFLRVLKIFPLKLRQKLFKILCMLSKGFFGGQLLYKARLPVNEIIV